MGHGGSFVVLVKVLEAPNHSSSETSIPVLLAFAARPSFSVHSSIIFPISLPMSFLISRLCTFLVAQGLHSAFPHYIRVSKKNPVGMPSVSPHPDIWQSHCYSSMSLAIFESCSCPLYSEKLHNSPRVPLMGTNNEGNNHSGICQLTSDHKGENHGESPYEQEHEKTTKRRKTEQIFSSLITFSNWLYYHLGLADIPYI